MSVFSKHWLFCIGEGTSGHRGIEALEATATAAAFGVPTVLLLLGDAHRLLHEDSSNTVTLADLQELSVNWVLQDAKDCAICSEHASHTPVSLSTALEPWLDRLGALHQQHGALRKPDDLPFARLILL